MSVNLMLFEQQQVEVFELNGVVYFNPYHVGNCLELTKSAVKMAICKMNKNQVTKLTNSKVKDIDFRKLNNTGENFLTESGVYKLAFKSHKPNAEKFSDWVADEVLPSIRKTGFYSTEKTKQHKIETPHNIVKKFYNGNPVMVLKDLEAILNVPVGNLSYYLRNNSSFKRGIDYFLLEGKELKRFKEYNNVSPFIGNLIIMPKQGVDKLIKLLVLSKKDMQEIEEYFKLETKEPHNNMPILEQLQVCKFIADDFKINEAIKMSIYKMICEKNGIGSEIIDMIKSDEDDVEEFAKKLLELLRHYLKTYTADEVLSIKKKCISRNDFKFLPTEGKEIIVGFFNITIKILKQTTKTAV